MQLLFVIDFPRQRDAGSVVLRRVVHDGDVHGHRRTRRTIPAENYIQRTRITVGRHVARKQRVLQNQTPGIDRNRASLILGQIADEPASCDDGELVERIRRAATAVGGPVHDKGAVVDPESRAAEVDRAAIPFRLIVDKQAVEKAVRRPA